MKKFNNIKMTEEELDHVAGGQNYLVLERQKNGVFQKQPFDV